MKGKERHCVENFVPKTFVSKTLVYVSIKNENGCSNKVAIELSGVQLFWSD